MDDRHTIWDSIDVLTGAAAEEIGEEMLSPAQRKVNRDIYRAAVKRIDARLTALERVAAAARQLVDREEEHEDWADGDEPCVLNAYVREVRGVYEAVRALDALEAP